jgi:hypothetical protein
MGRNLNEREVHETAMRMTDTPSSILRGHSACTVIVIGLLAGPGCGPSEASRPAPDPTDGKAVRAFLAKAPKGFGPSPKTPLGKLIIDAPAPAKKRRK